MLPNCHLPVLSEDVSPETQLNYFEEDYVVMSLVSLIL